MTKPTQLVISEQAREAALNLFNKLDVDLGLIAFTDKQEDEYKDLIAEHFQLLLNSQLEAIIRECAEVLNLNIELLKLVGTTEVNYVQYQNAAARAIEQTQAILAKLQNK